MRIPTPNKQRRRSSRTKAASGGPVAPEASFVARRDRRPRASARGVANTFPRRRPSVAVRRSVLALLILASMALITASYRGGAVLHGSQLVVLQAVAPIERGLSRAWDPVAGAWDWTGRLFTATSENPVLERENAELKAQLRLAEAAAADYERALEGTAFEERGTFPAGYEKVWASVIVRQPGAVDSSLIIDRGSSDGIAVDDAVLVVSGLAGKVIEVTPDTAVVTLIVDDAQRVSASIVGSDAWGVLRTVSTEGTPTMQLAYVKQSADVEEGDQVVTSGFASENGELRSTYPRGIPIGVVTSVGNDPADLNKTVQVTPFAEFDRIDEVMVLASGSGGAGS